MWANGECLELLIFATSKQLWEHFCSSVCHTFSLCPSHRIILKFSGVITIDKSDVHEKGPGQKSGSQSSKQISPQFGRFRIITLVKIYRWLQNDAADKAWSSIEEVPYFFRDYLSNFKVTRDISEL